MNKVAKKNKNDDWHKVTTKQKVSLNRAVRSLMKIDSL